MRTVQLIGGPANGEYVSIEDGSTEYEIMERLDSLTDLCNAANSQKEGHVNIRIHKYKVSDDSDFIFYHCQLFS